MEVGWQVLGVVGTEKLEQNRKLAFLKAYMSDPIIVTRHPDFPFPVLKKCQ